MRPHRATVLTIIAFAAVLLGEAHAADVERGARVPPALEGAVTDAAGVIDDAVEASVTKAIEAHRAHGVDIKVLVVRTTGGRSIKAYSLAAARNWGAKASQRRVLCVIAIDDRRVRLEVSDALRGGLLPDSQAAAIISEAAPMLKARNYGGALALMVKLLRRDTKPDDRRLVALLQVLLGLAFGFGLPLLAKRVDGPPRPFGPPKSVLAAYKGDSKRMFLESWYGSAEKAKAAEALHARGPRRSPWIYGLGLPLAIGGAVAAGVLTERPHLMFYCIAGVLHGFAFGMALLRSQRPLRPLICSIIISGSWLSALLLAGPRPMRDSGDVLLLTMLGALVLWPIAAYAKLSGASASRGGRRYHHRGGGGGSHGGSSGGSSSGDSGFSGGGASGSW